MHARCTGQIICHSSEPLNGVQGQLITLPRQFQCSLRYTCTSYVTHSVKMSHMSPKAILSYGQFNVENVFPRFFQFSQSTKIDLNFVSILIAKQRVTSQYQLPCPWLYSVSFIFPVQFIFVPIPYHLLVHFLFSVPVLFPHPRNLGFFLRPDHYFIVLFFPFCVICQSN